MSEDIDLTKRLSIANYTSKGVYKMPVLKSKKMKAVLEAHLSSEADSKPPSPKDTRYLIKKTYSCSSFSFSNDVLFIK